MTLKKLLPLLFPIFLSYSTASAEELRVTNEYTKKDNHQLSTLIGLWNPTPKFQLIYQSGEVLGAGAVVDVNKNSVFKIATTNQDELGIYGRTLLKTKVGKIDLNLGLEERINKTLGEGHLIYSLEKNNLFVGYGNKDKIIVGDTYSLENIFSFNLNWYNQGYSFGLIDRRFDYLILKVDEDFKKGQYDLVITFGTQAPGEDILELGKVYFRQFLQEDVLRDIPNERFDFPLKRTKDEYGWLVINFYGLHQKKSNSQNLDVYLTSNGWKFFNNFLISPGFQRLENDKIKFSYNLKLGVSLGPLKIISSYDNQENFQIWTRLIYEF